MALAVTLKVEVDRIRGLDKRTHGKLGEVVRKIATDIEATAKTLAPVDTGNLKNSIRADFSHVPVRLRATVDVGAEYGIYVEYGTVRSPSQPYLTPAVDAVRPGFSRAVAAAMRDAL